MGWRDALQRAAENRQDGAQTIALDVLEALASARPDNLSKEELDRALHTLQKGQPAMAPILRVCAEIRAHMDKPAGDLIQACRTMLQNYRTMQDRFLEHLKHDPPEAGRRPWVFFSWSSTVNRGMQTLFSESFEVPAALVGASRPGGEGRKTAAWLRERGVEVQLLSDADLFDRVGRGEAG
ncbi:hypothetical protein GF324_11420, partial [bacterium]|nr:hypothetical protein [bacterium]